MPNPLTRATEWYAAHQLQQDLVVQRDALVKQIEQHALACRDAEKDLRGLLGTQTPQRLFQVAAGVVVMVSASRGVEVVRVEAQSDTTDGKTL